MTRRKVEEPKNARTSLCFKQSELKYWKQKQKDLGFKSFSEFVRTCINQYLGD